jgi:uncharacterized radical SAM superfamily Fe-S cluster-containing enzyme
MAGWERVIGQVAAIGATTVQFIGGEPTLHPGLSRLVRRARDAGLEVEVFSNLVRVTPQLWETLLPTSAPIVCVPWDVAAAHAMPVSYAGTAGAAWRQSLPTDRCGRA